MPSTLDQARNFDDALSQKGRHIFRFQPGSASSQRVLRALPSPIEGYLQESSEHALVPESARGQAPNKRAQRFQRTRVELGGCQEREQCLVFEPHLRALRQDADPSNHVLGAHGNQVDHLPGRRQEGGGSLLARVILGDEARVGLVGCCMPGVEEVERGNDERVQLRVGQEAADRCGGEEARSQRVTRQLDGQSLHLRMRKRQRDRQQGFEATGVQNLKATAQDCQGYECVGLRAHERSLAAARKQLQVEATSPGQGGQVPDRQGDGRPDGRGHEGAQGPLTGLGLVDGHGEQAQGARIPPGTRGRQVGRQHLQEGVEQTIAFNKPLIDARFERARPAGRPLRTHGGRTVGGRQGHAAVAFLAQHPPHQLLAQLPIGAHEGQL